MDVRTRGPVGHLWVSSLLWQHHQCVCHKRFVQRGPGGLTVPQSSPGGEERGGGKGRGKATTFIYCFFLASVSGQNALHWMWNRWDFKVMLFSASWQLQGRFLVGPRARCRHFGGCALGNEQEA